MRALLLLTAATLAAQQPTLIHPGITPPKALKRVAPDFPVNASQLGHERSVVFELVISATGKVDSINPLHPAGYGFDEAALAAIKKWLFSPATKDGQPVPVLATIEVNFRLPTRAKFLRRQYDYQTYNTALTNIASHDPATVRQGLESLHALVKVNFPPAQFSEGVWRIVGHKLPQDTPAGLKLLLAAVEQNFPAAVGQAGIYYYEGRHLPADKEKGLRMLKSAAGQRNALAQLYLGELETEPADSAFYYRLCALQNMAACQSRLAEYYLKQPREEFPRAIAWLRLAGAQNYKPAQDLLAKHEPKLTDEEKARASTLRSIADLK